MSLWSRLEANVRGAGHIVTSSVDSVLDGLSHLNDDEDAFNFGDFLKFAKTAGKMGLGYASGGASLFKSPGQAVDALGVTSAVKAGYGAAGMIRRNLIEPVTSHIPDPARGVTKAVTGTLYHSVADPISTVVELSNSAYNEVSRGISTVVLASELQADKDFQEQIKDMPLGERLGHVNRLAWDAAKETSPGQAISYALGGNHIDITDPQAVAKVIDSPWFSKTSGGIDAALRIYADPTALALGRVKNAQEAFRVKQAFNFTNEAATAVGTAAEKAAGVDELYDAFRSAENPAIPRHQFFAKRSNQAAHIQATALWDAAHMPDAPLGTARTLRGSGLSAAPAAAGDLGAAPSEIAGADIARNAAEDLGPAVRSARTATSATADVIDITPRNQASREKFNVLLRAMMGNEEAVAILRKTDTAMAERVAMAQQMRNWAHVIVTPDPANPLYRVVMPDFVVGNPLQLSSTPLAMNAAQRQQLDSLIESLIPQAVRASREADTAGTLIAGGGQLPRVTRGNTLRTQVVRSQFWQTHPLGRTLRVFADINPQNYLNLHEASDFDIQVNRMLTNVGLDITQRDAWREAAMRAQGAGGRRAILAQLDDVVIDHYAAKHGIDADILREARDRGRTEMDSMIAAAKYDAESETTILRTVTEAGEAEDYRLPLHPTQLENWAGLPNYKEIDRIAKNTAGTWSKRELVANFGDGYLNPFYRVWKPAVLFGIRTPTRIVGEESLRFMSQVGAITAGESIGKNLAYKVGDKVGVTDEALRYLPGTARKPIITPLGEIRPSLGHDGVLNAYSGALNASAGGVLQYGSEQDRIFRQLADSFKDWKTLTGTDPGHMEAWLNDINKQIRQAPLAKRLLDNGGDVDDAVRWLRTSEEGKVTMRANKLWARDPEGWAMSVEDQLGRYLPTDDLRAAATRGGITEEMLTEAFPVAASRPEVHGQMLAYTIGGDHISKTLLQKLDAFHQYTSVQPSIQVSRQPMFDTMYRQSVQRQVDQAIKLGRREAWSMEDLRQVERNAHREAIGQVRETLYDMAEHSRLAEATRFIAPFANATREVVTTWAGIAVNKPAFVRRIQIAWKAPERAGWVYDSEGNQVHEDGSATSPLGKKVKAAPGRTIRVRFPDWANDIPGLGKIIPDTEVFVNKDSLNTILANPYGTSPVIEVAFARLIDNAEIETQLAPFFPYGVDRSIIKPFLPSPIRAAAGRFDAEQQGRAAMQLYWSDVAEYEANGRQGEKPSMQKSMRAAGNVAWLQVLAKMTLPASVRMATPMQPYIDIYKEMQRNSPDTAQEDFLDKYGSEFAALTASMTKTINHVQPTLEAYKKGEAYKDLIAKYPELGAIVVGEVSDPFNPAVYDRQLRSRVGGENFDPQRRRITPNEAREVPGVTAGWYEFSKGMDAIEAQRIQLKLPNLRVKGAQKLAAAKTAFIEALSEKYPEWQAEYMKDDPVAYERRIKGMREVVKALGGHGRTDIDYLGHYLEFRDTMEKVLNQRVLAKKSGRLDSAENARLLAVWETGVGTLIEQSPAFQRLWNRYLDHDQPQGHRNG